MKKPISTLCLSLALAGAIALPALAAAPKLSGGLSAQLADMPISAAPGDPSRYTLQVDGKAAADIDVCMMVPLRAIAEQLGFSVTWNDGTVLVDDGAMHTTVTIGTDSYLVTTSNSELVGMSAPFSLGAAPYVDDGVTYVPLTLFHALLGNKPGVITVEGTAIVINTAPQQASGDSVEIPNPFADCRTMDEAAALAGFDLAVSGTPDGFAPAQIRAMKNSMVEVLYTSADADLRIRKGVGAGDISGDYNLYAEGGTLSVGNLQVATKGADGLVRLATWTENGYTFSVSASSGMTQEQMTALVGAIQ